MYVISDERDIINLRSNHRKNDVYVYPVHVKLDIVKELFVDMLKRANKLKDEPEFFNTAFSTCTTNIVDHVNKIANSFIPKDYRIWIPQNADELAYELGLLDNSVCLPELRKKHLINSKAKKYANHEDFSIKIRSEK